MQSLSLKCKSNFLIGITKFIGIISNLKRTYYRVYSRIFPAENTLENSVGAMLGGQIDGQEIRPPVDFDSIKCPHWKNDMKFIQT